MATTGGHADENGALTLAFVRGVLPGKWQRIWNERHPDAHLELVPTEEDRQLRALDAGRADMALVRLPLPPERTEDLHVIPLYEEVAVVLAATDHVLTAAEELTLADLEGELVHPTDAALLETIEVVRAGVGVLILPQSVARMAGTKGLDWRPLADAPTTRIALAWPRPAEDADPALLADLDDFVGVVRGRKASSTRGRTADTDTRAEAGAGGKRTAATPAKGSGAKGSAAKGNGATGTERSLVDKQQAGKRKAAERHAARSGRPRGGKRTGRR